MKTPDLPGSFIAAIAGNVVAVAVAFGAPLTGDQQKALLALAVTLGSVLVTAGAWLHGKRAANADKLAAAKAVTPIPATFVSTGTSTTGADVKVTASPLAPTTLKKPAAKKPPPKKP